MPLKRPILYRRRSMASTLKMSSLPTGVRTIPRFRCRGAQVLFQEALFARNACGGTHATVDRGDQIGSETQFTQPNISYIFQTQKLCKRKKCHPLSPWRLVRLVVTDSTSKPTWGSSIHTPYRVGLQFQCSRGGYRQAKNLSSQGAAPNRVARLQRKKKRKSKTRTGPPGRLLQPDPPHVPH